MTQAAAELDETVTDEDEPATDAQSDPEFKSSDPEFESDVLSAFADDDQAPHSTTSLGDGADASAKPENENLSGGEEVTPIDDLPSAITKRIADLEANYKKYSDDVYGRVGLIEQVMKAQAKTPIGKQVRLKKEHFKEFAEEYPEFAEAQVQAINQVLEELELTGLSQGFTTDLIKGARTAAEAAAEQRYEHRRVLDFRDEIADIHPDWEQIIGLPDKDVSAGGIPPDTEFRRWLKTQPDGYENRITTSYSAVVVGRAIDKFNEFKKHQNTQATQRQGVRPIVPSRQDRLRAAVAPRSSGTVKPPQKEISGRDAMLAEFSKS